MFGAMDPGDKITAVVTVIAVLGLAIAAIRWFRSQD
jgi:hypothetical protein